MMVLKKYLLILLLIPLISACSEKPKPTAKPIIEKNIPIQPRPKQVTLNDVEFYVVSDKNLEEFIERYKNENGHIAFVAMTPRGYENISLNVAELRRYMNQQKQLITYYENSIQNK
jgi:hypothetical protein